MNENSRQHLDHREYRPGCYHTLSENQINQLHDASLGIMEKTGMCFHEPEALDLFRKAGANVSKGNTVRIPHQLVERSLASAPKKITIYDRNGQAAMILEGQRSYFGPGSDCQSIYDLKSGQHRQAVLGDVVNGVRLVDALPNMDYVMSMFQPFDVDQKRYEQKQMSVMLQESTKPVIFVGLEKKSSVDAIGMAEAVAGSLDSLQEKPFIINYVNVVSPFQHNTESVERLLYAAERNLPSIYMPGSIRGVLSPMTLAGSMALANAAQLAGLVLSQLKREGSPIILGGRGGGLMDMRTMLSVYAAPDCGPYGWDLAHSYHIPTFTSACTDAKVFDGQAAAETALTLFEKALNGANIIHNCGYLDCAMTGSLEMVVFCDEVIGWIKQYWLPVELTEESLALDLIHEMGPDGQFMETEHTFRHVRETWMPTLFDRNNFHTWSTKGSVTLQEKANKKAMEITENHRAEPLPRSVVKKLEAIAA